MGMKEKKIPDSFCQDYKGLPLKARASVITTAQKMLEIQKENKVFLGKAANPSAYEDGGKRG